MVTLFTNQTPADTLEDDSTAYTLGTTFYTTTSGFITGVRWYFPSTLPTGTVTAQLWDYATETQVGSATFVDPVAGTWNTATFDDPVAIAANAPHIASVWTANRYVFTSGFWVAPLTNSPLTGPQDNTDPLGTGSLRNGRLNVGASPAYPGGTAANTSFFVDPVWVESVSEVVTGAGTSAATATDTASALVTALAAGASASAATSTAAALVTVLASGSSVAASTATASALLTVLGAGASAALSGGLLTVIADVAGRPIISITTARTLVTTTRGAP